jgi:4-amino-4-deoxy-L-arabinose transferase-like glycosyltransferase
MTTSTLDGAAGDVAVLPRRQHREAHRMRRASLVALLLGTALLYLWGLGASGYANEFYAAAVQAGTKSWQAFFFGSFDSANFITVDKPPLSLWPMEISGRIFGFSSWSMLVPQALEGVAAVWLLHATVRRWFGHWAGILAGALLALTPVAVLMFRFNNPDALMVLLVVGAAYCTTRALESAATRWLLGAGAVMGLAFLAKGLQPFTVLPALAIAYLVAAPTTLRRRVLQLLGAGAAVVAGAGWWVLAVQLTPAADRPYIGGSGDNSPLGLAFGYNGISRLSGSTSGPGGGFDGSTGIGRLFNSLNGGQIAWLLPTSLLALGVLGVASRRAGRTDRTRAACLLWGGWLLVTGAVLSFAGGIIHTYYTVELAPAVAALVAIGTVLAWRSRARGVLAVGALAAGSWTYALLRRTPSFHPWVGYLVVLAAVVTAGALLLPGVRRRLLGVALAAGLVTLTAGPGAYALDTAATPHTGAVPSAGPTVSGTGGPGGFRMPAGSAAVGGFGPAGGARPAGGFVRPGSRTGFPTGRGAFPTGRGAFPTGRGGFPARGALSANSALSALLKSTTTTWAAATVGSQVAAPLELASGKAVMAIGGFNGGDAAPTLAEFEHYVQAGKIRYFIAGGVGGGQGGVGGPGGAVGGQGTGTAIEQWVAAHYTATTVGGMTVYDLAG